MLPAGRDPDGPFAWWQQMRPRFFDGFHRCLPALAAAGNDLIVEHIIEFRAWREYLAALLGGLDVFVVGVYCDLTEIDRREWGLKWNQALETGGVLVANKVRVEGELQFVRQGE